MTAGDRITAIFVDVTRSGSTPPSKRSDPNSVRANPGSRSNSSDSAVYSFEEVSEIATEAAMQATTTPMISSFRSARIRRKSTVVRRPVSPSPVAPFRACAVIVRS